MTSYSVFTFLVEVYELLTHDDKDSEDTDADVRKNIGSIREFLNAIKWHIFGQKEKWLTVENFGFSLYHHLSNPKKPKHDNRQKQYKQYKKVVTMNI